MSFGNNATPLLLAFFSFFCQMIVVALPHWAPRVRAACRRAALRTMSFPARSVSLALVAGLGSAIGRSTGRHSDVDEHADDGGPWRDGLGHLSGTCCGMLQ